MKLAIKVVPGASKTELAGWLGDVLKVRVSAPPERGKANAAVEALLCDILELKRGAVQVVSGQTSQRKILEIRGMDQGAVLHRLGKKDMNT